MAITFSLFGKPVLRQVFGTAFIGSRKMVVPSHNSILEIFFL